MQTGIETATSESKKFVKRINLFQWIAENFQDDDQHGRSEASKETSEKAEQLLKEAAKQLKNKHESKLEFEISLNEDSPKIEIIKDPLNYIIEKIKTDKRYGVANFIGELESVLGAQLSKTIFDDISTADSKIADKLKSDIKNNPALLTLRDKYNNTPLFAILYRMREISREADKVEKAHTEASTEITPEKILEYFEIIQQHANNFNALQQLALYLCNYHRDLIDARKIFNDEGSSIFHCVAWYARQSKSKAFSERYLEIFKTLMDKLSPDDKIKVLEIKKTTKPETVRDTIFSKGSGYKNILPQTDSVIDEMRFFFNDIQARTVPEISPTITPSLLSRPGITSTKINYFVFKKKMIENINENESDFPDSVRERREWTREYWGKIFYAFEKSHKDIDFRNLILDESNEIFTFQSLYDIIAHQDKGSDVADCTKMAFYKTFEVEILKISNLSKKQESKEEKTKLNKDSPSVLSLKKKDISPTSTEKLPKSVFFKFFRKSTPHPIVSKKDEKLISKIDNSFQAISDKKLTLPQKAQKLAEISNHLADELSRKDSIDNSLSDKIQFISTWLLQKSDDSTLSEEDLKISLKLIQFISKNENLNNQLKANGISDITPSNDTFKENEINAITSVKVVGDLIATKKKITARTPTVINQSISIPTLSATSQPISTSSSLPSSSSSFFSTSVPEKDRKESKNLKEQYGELAEVAKQMKEDILKRNNSKSTKYSDKYSYIEAWLMKKQSSPEESLSIEPLKAAYSLMRVMCIRSHRYKSVLSVDNSELSGDTNQYKDLTKSIKDKLNNNYRFVSDDIENIISAESVEDTINKKIKSSESREIASLELTLVV